MRNPEQLSQIILALAKSGGWSDWIAAPSVAKTANSLGFDYSAATVRDVLSSAKTTVHYKTRDGVRRFQLLNEARKLLPSESTPAGPSKGLRQSELLRVVNQYIGVVGGYLGDFTYRNHREFYPEYCDVDIDPEQYPGTSRERFILVLQNASASDQAKILRGVVKRFPINGPNAPLSRTESAKNILLQLADKLDANGGVESPGLGTTSEVVELALADAETLLRNGGPISAVDRLHTALHGYLRTLCVAAGIVTDNDASIAALFKMLHQQHPAFQQLGPRPDDILKTLRSMGAIVDALSPMRNNASVAHPNEQLLEPAEAMLVVNTTKTLLHYIKAKSS